MDDLMLDNQNKIGNKFNPCKDKLKYKSIFT